jgi:light-regulated signal transduction histidine kinase (bacteriophytochrome)
VRTHLELARVRKAWTQELEEANKELEAFSYSVSHDLRAPLRAIDGFSRIVLDDYGTLLETDGRQYLERIRSNAQRMSTLIDGLLSLAHITKGTLKKESIDITKIARAVVADLQVKDSERHVVIDIPDGLTAVGDTGLIAAVIANLVGNAWKFTSKKDDACVTVGMQQKESQSIFFVRDNGAGFDMAYSNKLFEPFKRLHTKSEFEGTGIGLATVQRIIARHKGQIWAESEVGQGATFYFTLGDPQR